MEFTSKLSGNAVSIYGKEIDYNHEIHGSFIITWNFYTEMREWGVKSVGVFATKIFGDIKITNWETDQEDFIEFDVDYNVISRKFDKAKMKLSKFDNAIRYVDSVSSEISENIRSLNSEMNKLNALINGNKSKAEPGEKDDPSIYDRVSIAMRGLYGNTYGPTKGQLKSFEIAKKQWSEAKPIIENFVKNVNKTNDLIEKIGSPKIID